jgi:hypothetical protein
MSHSNKALVGAAVLNFRFPQWAPSRFATSDPINHFVPLVELHQGRALQLHSFVSSKYIIQVPYMGGPTTTSPHFSFDNGLFPFIQIPIWVDPS